MSTTMKLRAGTEAIDVGHAVASGRARVEIAKIEATETMDPRQRKIIEALVSSAQAINSGAADAEAKTAQTIQDLIRQGALTVDDVVAMQTATSDPSKVEEQVKRTFALFRVAANIDALPTGWKERVSSDDFLLEQDIAEMEAFIASFRGKVVGG